MKKIAISLTLLLILSLTACTRQGGGSSSSPTSSEVPLVSINDEIKAGLAENIIIWEEILSGESLTKVAEFYDYGMFSTAYCQKKMIAQREDGALDVTQELSEEIAGLFFENVSKSNVMYCYADYTIEPKILSHTRLDNGNIEVLVGRTLNGMDMQQNKYVFAQRKAPAIKSTELAKVLKEGDTIFSFVSIEHVPFEYPEGKTINISTSQDIIDLATEVNSGKYNYVNNTYILQNNIDLAGVAFDTIGVNRYPDNPAFSTALMLEGFNAIFDGNGKTISGFNISNASANGAGFFSLIGEKGVVKNLTLKGTVDSMAFENIDGTGGLAGQIAMGGTIDNCHFSGTVKGVRNVGGLVGSVYIFDYNEQLKAEKSYIITSSSANSDITTTASSGGFIGVNWDNGIITGNSAAGTLTIEKSRTNVPSITIGGFIGEAVGGVNNCHSAVKITGATVPNRMGNFAGEMLNCSIIECTVEAATANPDWYNVGWQHYKTSKVDIQSVTK